MKILYAEDEKQLSSAVTEILKMEGFAVTQVFDGGAALAAVESDYFDAVVLDVMMPVMDGMEVLRRMRGRGDCTPVLMLTAKAGVGDRVAGISTGADDYLGKPFAMKELVVRINSLIRRASGYRRGTLSFGNVTLDMGTGELSSDKGSLRLSNKEAELLAHLVKNKGVFYTAEQLNALVWGGRESAEKAELYAYYLKNKLTQIRSENTVTVSGDSFMLAGEEQ